MKKIKLTLALVIPFCLLTQGNKSQENHWYDGKAEVDSYDLTIKRYGEDRQGTAVAIFVTEPFNIVKHVKSDSTKGDAVIQAMKLNLVEDFPTGIYDYNLMTSAFASFGSESAKSQPLKVSFSSQEWCGQSWQQFSVTKSKINLEGHSYFEGEGDTFARSFSLPKSNSWLAEDALLLWARGLTNPILGSGESAELDLLTSLKLSRLEHKPVQFLKATLKRSKEAQTTNVALGKFQTYLMTIKIANNTSYDFFVESTPPHRIVKWEYQGTTSQKAELVGSKRMTYWEMNANKYQKDLKEIGLNVRPKRTP